MKISSLHLFIILIISIILISSFTKLEIVPDSYGTLINNPGWPSDSRRLEKIGPNVFYGFRFEIPEGDKNIITDAEYRFWDGWSGETHLSGFSRTLTSDTNQWESLSSFSPGSGEFIWAIKDAVHQSTGGPIRVEPGEIWYLMIRSSTHANTGYNIHSSVSTYNTYGTTVYIQKNNEFVEAENTAGQSPTGGTIRIYGYRDETFYVDFSYSPTHPTPGDSIDFIDTSNQNLIELRQWYIDQIPISNEKEFSHIFEEEGEYTVSITGTSYAGTSFQTSKLIIVEEQLPPEPPEPPDQPDDEFDYLLLLVIITIIVFILVYLKKRKLI